MTHIGILAQKTLIEWQSGKRVTLPVDIPIAGRIEDGFFCFDAAYGPARLPVSCFEKIEKA